MWDYSVNDFSNFLGIFLGNKKRFWHYNIWVYAILYSNSRPTQIVEGCILALGERDMHTLLPFSIWFVLCLAAKTVCLPRTLMKWGAEEILTRLDPFYKTFLTGSYLKTVVTPASCLITTNVSWCTVDQYLEN